jgi:hypothetical protein
MSKADGLILLAAALRELADAVQQSRHALISTPKQS